MELWIGIAVTVIIALIGTIWAFTNKRIEKTEIKVQEHEVELAVGGERFEAVQSKLEEIHTDVRDVKKNCPKCSG